MQWKVQFPDLGSLVVYQGIYSRILVCAMVINYLPNLSRELKVYVFVAVGNIYYESKRISFVVKRANSSLIRVKKSLDTRKLSINISNANYIICHFPLKSIPLQTSLEIGKKHFARISCHA